MDYVVHVLIFCAIYAILAVSLDLMAGHLGLLSIAHSAFYGLGAYTAAIVTTRFDVSFPLATLAGVTCAVSASLLISLPSLRLRGDYFIIATFGFQMIMFGVFSNWQQMTGGPMGLSNIPQPSILGWRVSSHGGFLFLAIIFAVVAFGTVVRITKSPLGRVLHAIREDETFAQSLGKNVYAFRVLGFGVSAGLAAIAGSLYAHYISYLDPTSFTLNESILIVAMVILGGAGTARGPLLGAVVLVGLPEVLRFAGIPGSAAANIRQILYGLLLVIMMLFRPRGLIGKYSFGR